MRGFLVFDDSHSQQVAAAAEAISLIFRLRGIDGTAKWYWGDYTDSGIEYGVTLDIPGWSEDIVEQMRSIWQLCVQQFNGQEVRLEIEM